MTDYVVTAPAAVVRIKGAQPAYRYRGALVPGDAENLQHLLDVGLIAPTGVAPDVEAPKRSRRPKADGGE